MKRMFSLTAALRVVSEMPKIRKKLSLVKVIN